MSMRVDSRKSAVIVGVGNIGSQLAPLIARILAVGRVVVIDKDLYDASNVSTQNILPRDVGQPKANVVARLLRAIRPDLEIECFRVAVEDLPLGKLRADVMVVCVDSRATRQWLNQAAHRLGICWVDTAVDADGLIARVAVYGPGPDQPCYECPLDASEYARLETSYPCAGMSEAPPTGAPAELGALVASYATFRIRLVLAGALDQALVGWQLLIAARHHRQYLGRLPASPGCRFDHTVWPVEALHRSPGDITIGDALALIPHAGDDAALHLEGKTFAGRLTCTACGRRSRRTWRLTHRLEGRRQVCHRCGGPRVAAGFDQADQLPGRLLSPAWLRSPLSRLGYRSSDIFSVTGGGEVRHFELGD